MPDAAGRSSMELSMQPVKAPASSEDQEAVLHAIGEDDDPQMAECKAAEVQSAGTSLLLLLLR